MASIDVQERWVKSPDGHELFAKSWTPSGSLKAKLLLLHGFSDHCDGYKAFFHLLVDQNIQVVSYDQRGFGRSVHTPQQKGVTGPTSQVLSDITFIIDTLLPRPKDDTTASIPIFLMGHSMGGEEVLTYLATGPRETLQRIRGFLLEAPLLAMTPHLAPPDIAVTLASLAARIFPHKQLVSKLDPKFMSHDPEVCRDWDEDVLCHDTVSLETFAEVKRCSLDLIQGKAVVREGVGEGGRTRLWMSHGTEDDFVSFEVSKKWFDEMLHIEDKEFRAYEGWYHKLHAEAGEDKATFAMDVATWILARSGPAAPG